MLEYPTPYSFEDNFVIIEASFLSSINIGDLCGSTLEIRQTKAREDQNGKRTATDAKAACARKGYHRSPRPGRLQAKAG
jgi:hypothetical protein